MQLSELKYEEGVVPNNSNKVERNDRAIHDWYRFVLSFPPHLVQHYLEKFGLMEKDLLLDPFCGTGTTLVEAQKRGIRCIGIEANPMAYFASKVKLNWDIDPQELQKHALKVVEEVKRQLIKQKLSDDALLENELQNGANNLLKLTPEQEELILKRSISPVPLHKCLLLLKTIKHSRPGAYEDHETLAFAKTLVDNASNLHFGPEVGVRKPKIDALVTRSWLKNTNIIASDIQKYRHYQNAESEVMLGDARIIGNHLEKNSIQGVFTSPPYPNEKDYSRTTRLESVLLGFIRSKKDLRNTKKNLIRSNTRGVYKDDSDDIWIKEFDIISKIADKIEARRISLGKTSGFEKLYGRVTKLYFGGMAKHLAELRDYLKSGAYLGYVVGDQASYLRVYIPTAKILALIAESLGYQVVSIDLFRTRFASATRKNMREEVLVLRWP